MKKWFIEISCVLFLLLFCYAAISKLLDYQQFLQQLQDSPLRKFARPISWLTPGVELLLSLLLMIPKSRKAGLYGSFLLMVSFTAYIIYILKYAPEIPCSCGGILENMSWTQHLTFNIAFTLLALLSIILYKPAYHTGTYRARTKILFTGMSLLLLTLITGAFVVGKAGMYPSIQPGTNLPEFSFLNIDSTGLWQTKDIPKDKPLVVTYFQPDCIHCQKELIDITNDTQLMNTIHFYFISIAPYHQVHKLYNIMQLEKHPAITFGIDTSKNFYNYLKPKYSPIQLVYNKHHRLQKLIPGEASKKDFLDAIHLR